LHYDVKGTGGKAFNIIIPLILATNTTPELEIQPSGDDSFPPVVGDYRYQIGTAIMLGDEAWHATGEVNYTREFRLALSVYVADISENNINALKDSYTQLYHPGGDNLLELSGADWKR
jgi:hypothetical protein